MIFQIDLKRQPEVADLISDMQMGDGVCFKTTLKSKNDSLAEFTLEKAEEAPVEAKDDDEDDDDESEETATVDGDSTPGHNKMPAPGGSRNTPGGSSQQDKMASALSAQL